MILIVLFGLLVLHLFLLINLQFTAWPEMLSYAYLRNEGFLLYKDMIHPYPPVLTMFLSLFYSLFGYGIGVLKTAAWVIILSSTVLVFWLVRFVTHKNSLALLGTAFYVALQPFLEGNMLWFDLAIVPPLLLATYFLIRHLREEEIKWIVLAGFVLGIAALIKQTAALFIIATALFLLVRHRSLKEVIYLAIGPLVLLVPLLLRLFQEGALVDFLNWTVLYPLLEWGNYPSYVQMNLTKSQLLVVLLLLLPLTVISVINIVRRKILRRPQLQLLFLFLIVSLTTIYPRFSFFHFQPALAFFVITLAFLLKEWGAGKTFAVFGALMFLLIPLVLKPAFGLYWQKEARFYGQDDLNLAGRINTLTDREDKIYLFGLHSGLYVMADRVPSKRWTDNFGWYLEIPGVQGEIIRRWEGNMPKYVLWRIPNPGNWFDLGTYQPKEIVTYIGANYSYEGELMEGVQIYKRK